MQSKKQMKDKKHNNGFNTPKDYFEDFEERLFSKLNEENLPKEAGFTTPKGYFEQLDSTILKNVNSTIKQTKVISIFSKRTLAYAAAIAACAVLIFSLVNSNNSLNNIDNIEISSIESYIEEGNLTIDSYDIASFLQDEDLNSITSESDFISEEILEDYLLENIDDSSILIE